MFYNHYNNSYKQVLILFNMVDVHIKYNPKEWTPCPDSCAYCSDPFYGHPKPHDTQQRLSDGKSAREVREEQSKLEKLSKEK